MVLYYFDSGNVENLEDIAVLPLARHLIRDCKTRLVYQGGRGYDRNYIGPLKIQILDGKYPLLLETTQHKYTNPLIMDFLISIREITDSQNVFFQRALSPFHE